MIFNTSDEVYAPSPVLLTQRINQHPRSCSLSIACKYIRLQWWHGNCNWSCTMQPLCKRPAIEVYYQKVLQLLWMDVFTAVHCNPGHLFTKRTGVSPYDLTKTQSCGIEWSHCSEIWQASRKHCCRGAYQIPVRMEKLNPESLGFRTSWDLAVRRPST